MPISSPSDLTPLAWLQRGAGMYDATSGGSLVSSDGAQAKRWEDATGNGHHFTSANGPTWNAADQQLEFSIESDQSLSSTTTITLNRQAFSVFLIGGLACYGQAYPVGIQLLWGSGPSYGQLYINGQSAGDGKFSFYADSANNLETRAATNRTLLGMVGSASSSKLWQSGAAETFSALGAGTFTITSLFGASSFPNSGNWTDALIFNRALSDSEVADLYAWARSARGADATPTATVTILGDSLTAGAHATRNKNRWVQRLGLASNVRLQTLGRSGFTAQDTVADVSAIADHFAVDGANNVRVIFLATNDVWLGSRTAAQIYGDLQSICAEGDALGIKNVVVTMLPRLSDSGREAIRIALNQMIRDGFADESLLCRAVADAGANAHIGVPGSQSNATYFNGDATHLTDAGHAELAAVVSAVLNPIISPIAPPAITSSTTAAATVGASFSYTIAASHSPASFNATGLPAGLSRTGAVISGTPTSAGTISIPISATNAGGTGTATLVLTISPASVDPEPPTGDVTAARLTRIESVLAAYLEEFPQAAALAILEIHQTALQIAQCSGISPAVPPAIAPVDRIADISLILAEFYARSPAMAIILIYQIDLRCLQIAGAEGIAL